MTWTFGPIAFMCPYCSPPLPVFESQEAIDAHAKAEHHEAWAQYEKMKNVTVRSTLIVPPK